jgi:hypothetical protein
MPLAHDKKIRSKTHEEKKPVKGEAAPAIPSDVLTSFLEKELTLNEAAKVYRVSHRFLWEKAGLERYRVNVWIRENINGGFCDSNRIIRSFFLCYDNESGDFSDKTL